MCVLFRRRVWRWHVVGMGSLSVCRDRYDGFYSQLWHFSTSFFSWMQPQHCEGITPSHADVHKNHTDALENGLLGGRGTHRFFFFSLSRYIIVFRMLIQYDESLMVRTSRKERHANSLRIHYTDDAVGIKLG